MLFFQQDLFLTLSCFYLKKGLRVCSKRGFCYICDWKIYQIYRIMTPATPEEVCRAISLDLKARGLTQQYVADRIGKSRAIVSNALSSKKRFSKEMAIRLSSELGYNIQYLLFGVGELRTDSKRADVELPTSGDRDVDYLLLASMVNIAEGILQTIGDSDALGAWASINCGDLNGYNENMTRLRTHSKGIKYLSPFLPSMVCTFIKTTRFTTIVSESNGNEANDD